MTSYGKSFRIVLRKFLLLLWKNFILRKRHYIISICEMLIPVTFSFLMSYARTKLEIRNETTYNWTLEETLKQTFLDRCNCSQKCVEAYFNDEDDHLASQVMSKLDDMLLLSGNNRAYLYPVDELRLSQSFLHDQEFEVDIIFKNLTSNGHTTISYTLRFPDEFVDTDHLIPKVSESGPNTHLGDQYFTSGFIGLQIMIDKILLEIITNRSSEVITFATQGFPYPQYSSMELDSFYSTLLLQFLAQSFIFAIPAIQGTVLSEKESGVKELMKMMGLPNWMHWLGWILNALLLPILSATIIIIVYIISYHVNSPNILGYIEPTLWWTVMVFYIMAGTSFCLFVSVFFEKPLIGTAACIVIWLVTYYAAIIPLEPRYRQLTLTHKMLLSFFPNIGVHFALKIRSTFENSVSGASWEQFAQPATGVDSLTFAHICSMNAISTFIYLTLTMYLENVIPSKYGIPKPWNFIFQWKVRNDSCKQESWQNNGRPDIIGGILHRMKRRSTSFEKEPSYLKIGVELQNISKVFGSAKIAIDNISLKMYEGRITVIVGENGAGKTTLVSLLTGLFEPTGGSAIINGHDIRTDMELIRQNLGVCPQQNMLFPRLTVFEHLMFVGRLKGLKHDEAKDEIKELLGKLQLTEKAESLSISLSGGQKRKLSLGCALIGGSQILILDEPTCGMDPKARRAVWDLLLEIRPERTIVLTTQIMEEAEILGDRIAILCDGKLQCYGSAMFLKNSFGDGYKLKLALSSKNTDVNKILLKVQNHIQSACLYEKLIPNVNTPEIWIRIPIVNCQTVSTFPSMLSELNEERVELGIEAIGLSYASMDDVFHRVVAQFRGKSIADDVTVLECKKNKEIRCDASIKFLQRFWSLLLKRITCLIRMRFVFICQLFSPVILVGTAIILGQGLIELLPPHSSLLMSLSSYESPTTLFYSDDERYNKTLIDVIGTGAEFVEDGSITNRLTEVGEQDVLSLRERYIVAPIIHGHKDSNSMDEIINATALYSTVAPHSGPLSVNLITNAVLRAFGYNNTTIEITSHPKENPFRSAFKQAHETLTGPQIPMMSGAFLSIGLALLTSSFVIFPAEERLSKVKHLQLMTGTSPTCYWASIFCCDFIFSLISIGLMLACFPVLETFSTFTNNNGLAIAFILFSIHAYSAIIFSYLISLALPSAAYGFAVISTIHLLSGMGFNVVIYYLDQEGLYQITSVLRWIFRLFPSYGTTYCAMTQVRIALTNRICFSLRESFSNEIGGICKQDMHSEFSNYTFCCPECSDFDGDTGMIKCFEEQPYLVWEYPPSGIREGTEPGIAQELVCMVVMGLIYTVVLILIEYRVKQRIFPGLTKSPQPISCQDIDSDVLAEFEQVDGLRGRNEKTLIVHGLSKHFGSIISVVKMSFAIQPGECFGLIGLNGAGKSTTFKMITGAWMQSGGNVYGIESSSLTNKRDLFLSRIGYCPQSDSLIGVLTGREILELFCRLRCVPKSCIKFEVAKWLTNIGLSESADIQCQNYSGGMRRRLCTAIAMIGDPPIVILDEPTSSVDPIARRQIWNILKAATNAGQAIVLTSHSLEECEIICSRIGIMVAGELKSIGTVAHLKSKFSEGISLTLKIKCLLPCDTSIQKKLDQQVTKIFRPCVLKYQNQNILQYEMLHNYMSWSTIFKTLEALKVQYPNFLDEYSVYETSLERILLSMSSAVELKKRICSAFEERSIDSWDDI